ncbi:MarR family transcriptional regulator [Streptomyces sp. AM 4-1-1]|uniref:MarR family winged helix-turn-helix transcriptional regulator n=1 Tax=Streptomyces sp. AM 4-1-1 TaxID=3028710 RepID=UPI0023B8EAA7|nr:MarR family transcriptional regulator [Streptomyces sp. AM 4-1-1]WEH34584.1 MarR family transcriptional regulator [Streptomyces sp. AM 4-1-1]
MVAAARGRRNSEHELWRQLLLLVNRVGGTLDKKLQRQHGVSVSEFTVLSTLADVEKGGGMRMQELADAVGMSQSTMSRLVGRLESGGLATRTISDQDRRAMYARITEQGKELVAEADGTFGKELGVALDMAAFDSSTASLVARLRHDPSV